MTKFHSTIHPPHHVSTRAFSLPVWCTLTVKVNGLTTNAIPYDTMSRRHIKAPDTCIPAQNIICFCFKVLHKFRLIVSWQTLSHLLTLLPALRYKPGTKQDILHTFWSNVIRHSKRTLSFRILLMFLYQNLHNRWVNQCRNVTKLIRFIVRHFTENSSHYFTRSCLG